MPEQFMILLFAALGLLALAAISFASSQGSLDGIKAKPVGDGQHGTARWATPKEIGQTFARVLFRPSEWRQGKNLPEAQGLVLGSQGKKGKIVALVDSDDIHCLMIGASGVGKTAFFLYPNLEYACASGISFLALDTKGDLARNYGTVAQKYYGYQVSVIDLRNPTRSDGFNFLTLVNHYMDESARRPDDLAVRAKAEKYAKILSKTIISPEGNSDHGQNAFFYDSAEGLLTAVILLLAEFLPPKEIDGGMRERRHIVSVFKLVQDLLEPSGVKGKSRFQVLMSRLPSEHKAKWFAGAALNTSEQAMASVLSTVLSRLNAFLDTELEQTICFDSEMDAESFASRKSAIFLILPEEDQTKNFMAGLMIQNLSRELFSVADENGGRLKNRVVLFCDELGTMPPFDILPLFSAGRSRRLTLVPTPSGRRDATLLRLLYDSAARVQELCDLRVRDVFLDNNPHILLHGKGNKSRYVLIVTDVAKRVSAYISENRLNRPEAVDMPLFFNQQHKKLTRAGVSYIIEKYASAARIQSPHVPKKITPHIFRHTKAMHLCQAGIDMIYIRDTLGHTDLATTEVYAKLNIELLRDALEDAYPELPSHGLPDWKEDNALMAMLDSL